MPTFARPLLPILLLAAIAGAQQSPPQPPIVQPQVWSAKPDIAAFEKSENDHLAAAQQAIAQIVAVSGAHTIANTLARYDEVTRHFDTAANLANLMQQVHPDAPFRDHATAMFTKVSSQMTALSLNPEVYQALSHLDVSSADAATRYYVQRQLLEFRLSGVDKDQATRQKLSKLQDQLTEEQSKFERNIADDTSSVEVANASEMEGLPQDYIAAHKAGADGKIRIKADEPDMLVLSFATRQGLRSQFWNSFLNRAYPQNREVLLSMMRTRYDIATLLGYSSWADLNAADKMIKTGSNIAKFIGELDAATQPLAQRELAMLLAEKRKSEPAATEIFDYESFRLNELVRRAQYNFDSASVRPYLPYQQVKQGIMDTAATLFHVSFRQETGVTAWSPSVETWDVLENGKMIGRLYLDMHPRPGKYSHAEEAPMLDGIRGKQLPEAALVCNFPEPTATDPGLMDYRDVETFFHEFGHLMHHILGGQQPWAGISGISMETDFVEAPSQMLEEWIRSPQVLASFARDYKTGAPIPPELVARMNRASAFGRANSVAFQTTFSAISYDVYKDKPDNVNVDTVMLSDLHHYSLFKPVDADGHMYASFDHLANYSSSYYTYMWDKVIAEDFFQQFDQKNMLAGDTPLRYRHLVLEPGGSMSANDLVKNFLGRPQNFTAFQHWLGEEFASGTQQ